MQLNIHFGHILVLRKELYHSARGLHNELTTERACGRQYFSGRFPFFEKQLSNAVSVAQIDPQHTAFIARALHPAAQGYLLSVMFNAEFSAGVCSVHTI
jgi:hypothetical protein